MIKKYLPKNRHGIQKNMQISLVFGHNLMVKFETFILCETQKLAGAPVFFKFINVQFSTHLRAVVVNFNFENLHLKKSNIILKTQPIAQSTNECFLYLHSLKHVIKKVGTHILGFI